MYHAHEFSSVGWHLKYSVLLFVVSAASFLSYRYFSYILNGSYTAKTFEFLPCSSFRDHLSEFTPVQPWPITNNENQVSSTISSSGMSSTIQNSNSITPLQVRKLLHRKALSVDYNFARRLRQAQTNLTYPLVNDIVVSKRSNYWAVYVIINNGNTMNEFRFTSNTSVVLFIGNKSYENVFQEAPKRFLRVLKYEVDSLPAVGKLSLYDYNLTFSYNDLPYVALHNQPKRGIAVCAYISNYNSVNEIKSLLAFYLLQNVDAVILYCAANYKLFREAFQMEIESGYVYLYEYPWPLTRTFHGIQYSVQGSQINSCYYRHRDYFEYIISQDVDEYFYSEKYPRDIYKAARIAFMLYPDAYVLIVSRCVEAYYI